MISYEPLWNTLNNKGITKYKLQQMGIDNILMNALRNNRSIII